jgi:tRNA(adenine34) deaminase
VDRQEEQAVTTFLADELKSLDLAAFMREALVEADAAGQAGELPIGAVLVWRDQIIARGRAQHRELRSDIRHAELNALLNGGDILYEHADECILFTTTEPCPLCLGAVVMADVPHIVYALADKVVHSQHTVATNPYVRRHLRSYYGGVLAEESVNVFAQYDPRTLSYIQSGSSDRLAR